MGKVASRKRLSRRKGDTYKTPKTSKIKSEESQHVVPDSSPSADLLHDSEPVFESIVDEQASENKPPNISIDNSKKEVCFESVKIDHVYASPIGSKPKFKGSASVPEPAVLDEELLLEIKHKIELFLPHRWLCLQADNDDVIRVVLISAQNNVSIQRSLEFTHNGDVNFFVHCNPLSIDPYLTGTLPPLPLDGSTVDYFVDRVITIVNNVRKMEICPGYDDEKYQVAWPTCPYGEKDSNPYRECRYSETFRSHACLRLVSNKKWRCSECSKLGKPLKRRTAAAAMETRKANTANKFLTESQMLNKLQEQRQELDKARKRIGRLHSKMEVLIKKEGVKVEQSMSDALGEILSDSKMTPAQSIFMQQQIKASQVEKSSSMRWHPTMLRLALAIHLTSPSAYELLRDTGMVKLPSSRTLFEYSHANRIKEGIDAVVIEKLSARVTKLCEEINPATKLPDKHKKYHILMADEMYISQNLVFQKFSGKLLGFTSLDDIDSEIRNLEGHLDNPEKELDPVMASKIMVYMVKGVSNGQKEVVATYASTNLSATQMYAWTWKVIGALERSGIAVVAFVCDGSSTNRAFIKKHKACDTVQDPNDIVYCTWNKCARERKLFFISDVPHLLKTIRNCMLNSRWDKLKSRRRMVKNGKRISWDYIIKLYNLKQGKTLRKSYKLNAMNVYPDSYARMKVKFAAEVLSKTVCKDLRSQGWADASETATFIELVNDWFDCLNGAHSSIGKRVRNENLAPYTLTNKEERFQVLDNFLKYLEDWENDAANPISTTATNIDLSSTAALQDGDISEIEGETPPEDDTPIGRRQLSKQTIDGIRMTTKAFKPLVNFLLQEGVKFINARIFNQDPLEQHFSKIRAGQGGSNNLNLLQALNKIRALHVFGHLGMKKRKGNSGEDGCVVEVTTEPLAKRKCVRGTKFVMK